MNILPGPALDSDLSFVIAYIIYLKEVQKALHLLLADPSAHFNLHTLTLAVNVQIFSFYLFVKFISFKIQQF